jgi:hypothetical protein
MQGSGTQPTNVVSMFATRQAQERKAADEAKTEESAEAPSFDDVMSKNQKNKERLEKERLAANKSVLRSYRIKN